MIARVVTKRDDARLALLVTGVAALALGLVVADDVWRLHLLPGPRVGVYSAVAALIGLGATGPWLAWTRARGRAAAVRCDEASVHIGPCRIDASEVRALTVARAVHGYGLAVTRGEEVVFLEVERADEATRIVAALGVREPPLGAVKVAPPSRVLAVPQLLLSLAAVVLAVGYFMVTTQGASLPALGDAKAFFGVGGVIAAELSMVLLVVRRLLRGHAVALARSGAWEAHVALHAKNAAAGSSSAGASEVAAEPARVHNLGRGEDAVGTWLARIDALPSEQHAYRGDAMKKDVLWETLGDDGAPVDARMAAARVLRRKYGEDEEALVRVVVDREVRVRVEAAMETQEEAERHIETLGPLFRAR